jgi:hypothetical protein
MIAYDPDALNFTPATADESSDLQMSADLRPSPATSFLNQNPSQRSVVSSISSADGLINPTHLSVEASKDAETTNSDTIPPSVGASDVVPVPMGEPEAVGSVVPTFQVLANSSLPMNLPLPANLGLPSMAPLLAAPANLGLTVDSDGPQVTSRKGTIMRPNPQSTTAR